MKLIPLLLLLSACGPPDPPSPENCVEFDHPTTRDGSRLSCRMLWCVEMRGSSVNMSGLAALWCSSVDGGGQ